MNGQSLSQRWIKTKYLSPLSRGAVPFYGHLWVASLGANWSRCDWQKMGASVLLLAVCGEDGAVPDRETDERMASYRRQPVAKNGTVANITLYRTAGLLRVAAGRLVAPAGGTKQISASA